MTSAASPSLWQPLRRPTFRDLWVAAVVSNVGTWMHDTAAGWTMTTLAPSPMMVSLMQTATSLPFFLLALPAGALADVVDRRRVLLATQAWMLVAAAVLGALAIAGAVTPVRLLLLTFALGVGAAMNAPAWAATTPELVPRAELASAVALGGISLNVARAVGPALGGFLVAAAGPGAVFLLNAASFVAVLGVIVRWRRTQPAATLPPERVVGAVRAGVRYARHSAPLRAVFARSAAFVLPASAVWALLPLVARRSLGLDASGYGIVLGGLGAGAIAGALGLPTFRARIAIERLLAASSLLFAVATAGLGVARTLGPALAATFAGGVAWMTTMSTVSVAAQEAAPGWVRARALAVSLLVIQGSLAGGAVAWGLVASHAGIETALLVAAAAVVAGVLVGAAFPLAGTERLDLSPSRHWSEPVVLGALEHDEGPVLVTIEYRVDPARTDAFLGAMRELETTRRRDGALDWGVYQDTADPWRWLETFLVESWIEHLRQHERVTASDRVLHERVYALLDGDRPRVSHLVARDGGER